MATEVYNRFYVTDPKTNLVIPNYGLQRGFPQLAQKAQFEEIINRMEYFKRVETLKSIGNFMVGIGLSIAFGAVAYTASVIGLTLLGAALAPYAISHPIRDLIFLTTGLTVGSSIGYTLYKIYAQPYFAAAQLHWDYSEQYAEHISETSLVMHGRNFKK